MAGLKRYWGWLILLLLFSLATYIYFYQPQFLDVLLQPTRREVYVRSLKKQPEILQRWNQKLEIALQDEIILDKPFYEQVITDSSNAFTSGYMVKIAQGEILSVKLKADDGVPLPWILEIYDEKQNWLEEAEITENGLELNYFTHASSSPRLILQAQLGVTSQAQLMVQKKAYYGFPLVRKTNASIKSFWGASRDGGSRSHEGNDLFASRGHPVVAVSNGRVTSIRNRGLGGKQIWIRDTKIGLAQYYAHLNDWNVKHGDQVIKGDTIGFVGNTGNARTTAPHLHFGIYQDGKAVDPKPYIWQPSLPDSSPPLPWLEDPAATGFSANLRQSPDAASQILQDLKQSKVSILGSSGNWYHVRSSLGKTGFAHKSILKEF
ncbi:M23 family metallopeptidase [Nonlabens xiamenensis]|uniref:M23 family metallopeptidase n=1 Tax=Nonlabens xiamenensis TaxID=2341043 RepID=UPI000F60C7D0|nr:M23 family metallopeptidase [Nonlabens xiamenensis]